MHTYSFRAEILSDVVEFERRLAKRYGKDSSLITTTPLMYKSPTGAPVACLAGGVVGEFTSNLSLEALREVLREQEDSHVILQTLQRVPWSLNTGERDYSL